MKTLRHAFMALSMTLVIAVFMTACGGVQMTNTTGNTGGTGASKTTSNTTGYPTTTTTYATPTTATSTNNYGVTPTATASGTTLNTSGNMNAFIHTAVATINGKKVNVLTTSKGFMLYYYTKDSMMVSNCTGGCAQAWPPLLAPQNMMTVTSSITLPKKLSVHKTANGNQVFYDGHPLYTYANDTQPGQFTGRGVGNAWYLVGFTL